VWVVDEVNDRLEEFNEKGEFLHQYGTKGTGNGQLSQPVGLAYDNGNLYVTEATNERVQEFSTVGAYVAKFGSEGTGNGQFKVPYAISAGPVTNDLYVTDRENNRVEIFTASGQFLESVGSQGKGNGQLELPTGVLANANETVCVSDHNNHRIEVWKPANATAHDTQTIYYTAGTEASVPSCQNHPEWANLSCQTQPAGQPENGLPNLPVTTVTYNMYSEPLVTHSIVGTDTRTSTATYDEAGRPRTNETTSTVGTVLPKITNKYSEATGALVEQSTSSESLKSVFNTLGQLTSYTDADGNISTLEYEPEQAARLKKINDGKGIQTLTYNETTGQVKELVDSAAGTFTAGYDPEGNLTNEGYPNGMTSTYTLNTAGERVGLVYKKITHCTEKCEWYTDNVVPSIHGQWLSQTSSLGKDAYTYDQTGRLVESQATPTGSGCVTHRYAYDEDTNRTSLSTYQPNIKGECATETGTTEKHTYDTADRLTDTGASYDAFGNTTSLPVADAGGSELTSGFYVDNQLASQTQAGETIGYNLDPAGRTRENVSTGKIVASEIQHYAGPGNTPAWTGETSGNWTRKISTMSGLGAIEHNGEAPILQLTNLHGDIVATAQDSETATGLASTIKEASDYGVPATETPPRYSWLGAHDIPTELPSGVAEMGVRSYVPQLGRFLQTDPRPGGSANAYAYVFGDPINSNDLTGEYGTKLAAWALKLASQLSDEEAAAYETALRAEAERKTREAAETAKAYAAMQNASPEGEHNNEEEGPEEEYWEEEGEEYGTEYVSDHHNAGPGHEEARVEQALLVSPLNGEETGESGEGATTRAVVPLCREGSPGPCVRKVYSPCGGGGGNCKKYVHHPPHVPGWVKKVINVGREVFGIVHCAYELWKQYGAGCGNP
jgi:RHS repeat-associated protein